jgi:hypothetical protein
VTDWLTPIPPILLILLIHEHPFTDSLGRIGTAAAAFSRSHELKREKAHVDGPEDQHERSEEQYLRHFPRIHF